MYYAILDTNAGLLQWIGEASSIREAIDDLDEQVGHDLAGHYGDFEVYELTKEEADEVNEWWGDNGGASHLVPECLRKVRR